MKTAQILGILSAFFSANHAHAATSSIEPINVTKVAQSGDFMPSIAPNAMPLTEITFKVMSSGCTNSASFEVLVNQTVDGQIVNINRIKPDQCKMMEHIAEITVSSWELRISQLSWNSSGKKYTANPIIIFNPQLVEDNTTH